MSITTSGWGSQGGLVTIGGWGGTAYGAPAMPARVRPRLARALELHPSLMADRADPLPRATAQELRPQVAAQDAEELPRATSLELKPQLTGAGTPATQTGPRLVGQEIKPKATSGKRSDKTPRAKARELRPQVVRGDEGDKPKQPKAGRELKPKITDGEGD